MAIQYVKYVCSVSVPVSVSVPAHSCKTTRSTYLAVENIHIFICPEASKWLWSKPFYRMPRKGETMWNLVNHTLKHSPRVNNNKIYENCATQTKAHRFRFFVPACAYEKSVLICCCVSCVFCCLFPLVVHSRLCFVFFCIVLFFLFDNFPDTLLKPFSGTFDALHFCC